MSSQTPERRRGRAITRWEPLRLGAAALLAAIATLFAVLNLDEVEVQLLFGSPNLPLVLVILISVVLGLAIGTLLGRRTKR